MRFFLLSITILLSSFVFAQKQDTKDLLKFIKEDIKTGQAHTITINTTNIIVNGIGEFKDQLIKMYPEKVFGIVYNENNHFFSFSYNKQMQKEDLIQLFEKYIIPNKKPNTNIDYKIK